MEGTATDTGSATTGPATFSDASLSWSDASSASTPSPESTPAASASADATDPPAADATTEGQPQQAGEPPKERWNDILANARAKAAEDALAPYAWAKSVDQQEFSRVVELARKASTDPIGYMQDFIKELQAHPQYNQQLRSLAAKALAQRQQAAETEPQPDLPIQLEDGRVVHLYSAEQQAKREAFLQKQWLQSVEQKLQPLQQSHEQQQARDAANAKQQAITHFVTTTYEDVKTWPGMDDKANQAKVAEHLARAPLSSDDPREVALALNAAYRAVVLPTLNQRTEARLLDNLQQKAAASTGVNPGSAAPSSPKSVTRFDQLGPEAWR